MIDDEYICNQLKIRVFYYRTGFFKNKGFLRYSIGEDDSLNAQYDRLTALITKSQGLDIIMENDSQVLVQLFGPVLFHIEMKLSGMKRKS